MKNIAISISLLFIFFSVSGCVGNQPVVVSGASYASESSPFYNEISLGSITGQNNSAWTAWTAINITSEFLEAYRHQVGQDLEKAYLLSKDKKGKYLLDIVVQKIDSPFVGAKFTTHIKYILKKNTGQIIWDKVITASHSVSFLDEPNSSARLHKSKLRALTKNSEIYVKALVDETPALLENNDLK